MPPDLRTLLREVARDPEVPLELDRIASTARRRTRRTRLVAATGLAIVVSVAGIAQVSTSRHEAPTVLTDTTTSVSAPRPGGIELQSTAGFDDVVVLGAPPSGYDDTGSLVSIDLGASVAHQRMGDARMRPGDFVHPLLVVVDRILLADLDLVRSMPVDLSADPVAIGDALFVVPSAAAGHVWLVRQDPMRAVEVDATGAVTRPERALPPDGTPLAAIDGGLLVSTPDGLVFWNPTDGRTRRVYDDRAVLAAAGDHAYLGDGLLLELSTGDVTFLGIAPGTEEAAAFSPDGRHLAVWTRTRQTRKVSANVYTDGASQPRVYDLADVGTIVADGLVWSPDNDAVYLLTSSRADGSADRLIGIPLGGSAQTVATIDQRGWFWLAVG